jgi:predicted alpha/beta-fold hydrolase
MTEHQFLPPRALRSPHVQTLLGSRGRGYWVAKRAAGLLAVSRQEIITCSDGVKLEAWVSAQPDSAPTVVLIHGWLGHADSGYVLSAGAELWAQGFSVVRLNLRDHGDTAHLNQELYNAARTGEVVEAVTNVRNQHATGNCGVAGFSLGGNFALRVARELGIDTIAICPAMNPATTMQQIDLGWAGYRLFFVRKWQNAMRRKQLAYPDHYRFDKALRLSTVSAMTDFFIREYSDYASTEEYFAAYTLTGSELDECQASIVFSEDDPVIPADNFRNLPGSLEVTALRHGGHCAFIQTPWQPTWIDRFLADRFTQLLA